MATEKARALARSKYPETTHSFSTGADLPSKYCYQAAHYLLVASKDGSFSEFQDKEAALRPFIEPKPSLVREILRTPYKRKRRLTFGSAQEFAFYDAYDRNVVDSERKFNPYGTFNALKAGKTVQLTSHGLIYESVLLRTKDMLKTLKDCPVLFKTEWIDDSIAWLENKIAKLEREGSLAFNSGAKPLNQFSTRLSDALDNFRDDLLAGLRNELSAEIEKKDAEIIRLKGQLHYAELHAGATSPPASSSIPTDSDFADWKAEQNSLGFSE
jgi:hypothetical protein